MASESTVHAIHVPVLLWRRTILELRHKSVGRRESGAFLLGRSNGALGRVITFAPYDRLDPNAYQSGVITFHVVGHSALWKLCRETGLQILADVHTHPGEHVGQSGTDQRNPMLPVVGHTAMIVPNFARTRWWSLRGVGVYEYLGEFKWRAHAASDTARRVTLTAW